LSQVIVTARIMPSNNTVLIDELLALGDVEEQNYGVTGEEIRTFKGLQR